MQTPRSYGMRDTWEIWEAAKEFERGKEKILYGGENDEMKVGAESTTVR